MYGDQLVFGQISLFYFVFVGQWMIVLVGEDEGVFGQYVEVEIWIVGVYEVDFEFDFVMFYCLQIFCGWDIQDVEVYVWVCFVEMCYYVGQEVECCCWQVCDGYGGVVGVFLVVQ